MKQQLAKEKEEATRIHEEALVIDGLFPTRLRPMGYTEKMKLRMEEMLANEEPLSEISDEMTRIFNRQLYKGETDYWQWWEQSGVNVIHTTIGAVEGISSEKAYSSAIDEIAGWDRRFSTFPQLLKVASVKDIQEVQETGKYGVILGFQNTHHIMNDLKKLELFYNFGIRIMQLTYNLRNSVGDGCTERTNAGLSEFGIRVVKKMNELGMLIDLSHSGYQTTMDTIELSEDPVAFTHTFCQSVYDHDRGKTNEEMEVLAENDGYMGILLVPDFISVKEPSIEDFLDHLEYAIGILGVDRVGIGTDTGTGASLKVLRQLAREEDKKQIKKNGITKTGWRARIFKEVVG